MPLPPSDEPTSLPPTERVPLVAPAPPPPERDGSAEEAESGVAPDLAEPLQPPIHPEDPDDSWVSTGPKRGLRVRVPTAALLLLLFLAGGFWVGAYVQKHDGSSSSGLSALASRFAGLRGAGGSAFSGFGGLGRTGTSATGAAGTGSSSAASGTTGLVTDVSGDTIDITTASGESLVVTIGPTTKVTQSKTVTPGSIAIGSTIVVAGPTSAGKVQASSVAVTPPTTAGGSGS